MSSHSISEKSPDRVPKGDASAQEADTLPPLLNADSSGYVRQNDGVTKIEALCEYGLPNNTYSAYHANSG